jgi:rhamnose transport system permease protein
MLFSVLIGVLSGALCGLFNGILVTKLKIPSIILTIGTLTLYRGIAQALASDFSLGGYPSWFIGIDYRYVSIIPIPVIIFTVFALIVGFLLSSTIYGKQLYLIGTNPQTAKYSGIKVDKIKLLLFTFSGVISGVAGVLTTSRLAVARFNMATGAELEIVLMVMLGGTYIFGGRGNIFGTFVAFWIVVILRSGFNVARIKIESQLTILGAMLIIAIILTNYIYSKSQK